MDWLTLHKAHIQLIHNRHKIVNCCVYLVLLLGRHWLFLILEKLFQFGNIVLLDFRTEYSTMTPYVCVIQGLPRTLLQNTLAVLEVVTAVEEILDLEHC